MRLPSKVHIQASFSMACSSSVMPSCPTVVGMPMERRKCSKARMPASAVSSSEPGVSTPITARAKRANRSGAASMTYRDQAPQTAARPAPWVTSNMPLSSCSSWWLAQSPMRPQPPRPQPVRLLWDRLPAHMMPARAS